MAIEDIRQLPLQAGAPQRSINEVWTIERSNQLDSIFQTELRGDIAPDPPGCRRRVRVKADGREDRPQPPELTVLGTEIMPPLADAMRLVHGNEADLAAREHRDEGIRPFAGQALRRHVDETVASFE